MSNIRPARSLPSWPEVTVPLLSFSRTFVDVLLESRCIGRASNVLYEISVFGWRSSLDKLTCSARVDRCDITIKLPSSSSASTSARAFCDETYPAIARRRTCDIKERMSARADCPFSEAAARNPERNSRMRSRRRSPDFRTAIRSGSLSGIWLVTKWRAAEMRSARRYEISPDRFAPNGFVRIRGESRISNAFDTSLTDLFEEPSAVIRVSEASFIRPLGIPGVYPYPPYAQYGRLRNTSNALSLIRR